MGVKQPNESFRFPKLFAEMELAAGLGAIAASTAAASLSCSGGLFGSEQG